MQQKSYETEIGLYLIPTPIGNLQDITLRAIETFKKVDFLLCEDTRVTDQLLHQLNIRKKLFCCQDHNEEKMIHFVIKELKNGKKIGLVTDRGTPIISDPGYKVVKSVIEADYPVIALPGPTALIPALITSGIRPSPFLFYGFLNAKVNKKEKELQSLKNYPATLIFYEAPHRIESTLQSILKIMGDRSIAICREISKLHETIYRGSVSQLLSKIAQMRGEIVLIVAGNHELEDVQALTVMEHIQLYLEDGMSEKEAIKQVSLERNVPKSVIYKEYHTGK